MARFPTVFSNGLAVLKRDGMSFDQCSDLLVNLHESINLKGLRFRNIYVGKSGGPTEYRFSAEPRTAPGFLNSSCWKGYVAHFELDASGHLTLRKYVALDAIEQRIDEILTGEFWLSMTGTDGLEGFGQIQICFKEGRIAEDAMTWEGDRRLLAWVRMTSPRHGDTAMVGEIKWFGGLNGKTGRTNNYGFISASGGDVYCHRSQVQAPLELLTAGTQILFKRITGRNGNLEAEAVQILSQMSDIALVAAIKSLEALTAADTLVVAMHRKLLAPCENEVLAAVIVLAADTSAQLQAFWRHFTPKCPKDDTYRFAPDDVKRLVCKRHYAVFRQALANLFEPLKQVRTSLDVEEAYSALNEQDEQIAAIWANSKLDASQAKMLSARAAEKVVKFFYEGMGSSVEDVAIRQLEGAAGEWTTHDLLVDGTFAIDVKNARRPMHGKSFYVEHTVPRFKLDRRGANVRIAGLLSPYLQLEFIRDPGMATSKFRVDDLIFLGETSRDSIDCLVSKFASSQLEVIRVNERTIPNWVFGYPEAWYSTFAESVHRFNDGCDWPEGDEWQHVLDDEEKTKIIPALCVAGRPLPRELASKLSHQQVEFYSKLKAMAGNPPGLPVIFLAVLSDFLDRLKEDDSRYSPQGYLPLLFPDDPSSASGQVSYPLGAIDPLGLVHTLVETLTSLWQGRHKTDLARFSSFRFGGLGILQGREKDQQNWTTLVAYCGGTIYGTDESGVVQVDEKGKPYSVKGKCGHSPLVIGRNRTCAACAKLICSSCSFCSPLCQEDMFRKQAATDRIRQVKRIQTGGFSNRYAAGTGAAHWDDLLPLELYERDM